MNYIGKFISNFKEAYNEINAATLTGAIDVVVVRQNDDTFTSSPFHVRFGKIGVLRSREKVVDIEINGEAVDIHMKLGDSGEAFFVEEIQDGEEFEEMLGTSPLPSLVDLNPFEDDIKSQDSGVGAEEVLCKALKERCGKREGFVGFEAASETADDAVVREVQFYVRSRHCSLEAIPANDRATSSCLDEPTLRRGSFPSLPEGDDAADSCPRDAHLLGHASLAPGPIEASDRRDSIHRSKSLTNESVFRKRDCVTPDVLGCRTDVEEVAKGSRMTKKRRKKRVNRRRNDTTSDSQSSDNSGPNTRDLSPLGGAGPKARPRELVVRPRPDEMFVMDDVDQRETVVGGEKKNFVPRTESDLTGFRKGERKSVSVLPEFHPFSDTDISPPPSPRNARSSSPIKSDTEYECEKHKTGLSRSPSSKDYKWSWTWGELPTPPVHQKSTPGSRQSFASLGDPKLTDKQPTPQEEEEKSMLSNMFSFMRATKKARHNPEGEGIYLDDLNLDDLDPEIASLYFSRNSSVLARPSCAGFKAVEAAAEDDDVESGNGASLPHSPHSVDGAIGSAKASPALDSDSESAPRHPIFDYKGYHDVAFSLCGKLHEHVDEPIPESLFLQTLVTYDDFCENPSLLDHPDLVVRMAGSYYNWASAAPQILSLVLYQMPLPKKVREAVVSENMPKKEVRKRTQSKGYSWFSWGRNQNPADEAAKEGNEDAQTCDNSNTGGDSAGDTAGIDRCRAEAAPENSEQPFPAPSGDPTETPASSPIGGPPRDPSESFDRLGDSSESDEQDDPTTSSRRFKKTIRLSSEQIAKLNLRSGINEVVFSVTTAYQGTTRCKCHIFLWNHDEKIVISDIDGTITKSDVLGHILPIIGKDWAQGGVAQLFTNIKNNGYNFLYLSARAIGQARITREYLRSVRQGDISLPDGPLLLNPTSLIQAFHREVIEKKPEEFKISCLRDIKALFPARENPFYAGYGNKINDVWAYSAVGIPIQRIFTINHKGELKHELTQTFQTTYSNLTDIVNHIFPSGRDRDLQDDYSCLHYWKPPAPDFSAEISSAMAGVASK